MIWTILRKELLLEWRSREVLLTGVFYTLLLAMVFQFGFGLDHRSERVLAGSMWIAVLFLAEVVIVRGLVRERESGCLTALRMVPGILGAIFWGKWMANLIFMLVLELFLVIVLSLVFGLPLWSFGQRLAVLLILGTIGVCALGTVISVALAQVRMREVLLPLVLFPLLIPVLAAGVAGSAGIIAGDGEDFWGWVVLMAVFDGLYLVLSRWLFPYVFEVVDP